MCAEVAAKVSRKCSANLLREMCVLVPPLPLRPLAGRRGANVVRLGRVPEANVEDQSPAVGSTPTSSFGYEVGEVLGQGAMAVVKRAVRCSDRKEVALKCVNGIEESWKSVTRDEYAFMRTLTHPAIVAAFSIHESSRVLWVCMEYCADGSVEAHVERFGAIEEESATQLLHQLLTGVDYLHCARVVHRDLKPSNLLLTDNTTALKICDFNSAKKIGVHGDASGTDARRGSQMLTDRGSQPYKAPEVWFGALWNERVDVWTYGLCAYFMLWGSLPFPSEARKVHAHWLAGRNPHIVFGSMSEAMQKLILDSLTVDMNDRPSAMELLVHPAFMAKKQRQTSSPATSAAGDNPPPAPRAPATEILLTSCGVLSLCNTQKSPAKSSSSPKVSTEVVDFAASAPACSEEALGGGYEDLGEGSEWKERQYRKQALRHIMGNRWGRTVNTSRRKKNNPVDAAAFRTF